MDRSHLLVELLSTSDRAFSVYDNRKGDSASVVGYGLAKFQQGNALLNVGPVVATDASTALALCCRLIQHHEGDSRIDVFESQQELIYELITSLGFQQEGERQAIMLRHKATTPGTNEEMAKLLPGNRSVMFCPASQAWL